MVVRDEGLSFVKSLGRILFFLCLLPGFATYVHLRQQLSLPSNEIQGLAGGIGGSNDNAWQKNYFSDKHHIADIASHSYYWLPASIVNKNANRTERIQHSYWNLIVHQIPATSFFIALNVLLAFYNWNYNIQPAAVAKIYTNMVTGGEIWRSFSGPTAHFDLWHLALNMMSLSALGKEIEGSKILSSLAFWMYNITFIPLISGLWIGIQWIADHLHSTSRSTSNDNLHRPTVGYSGVLFAWMVVAALEQRSTCPVIFMPNLCFKTYDVNGFKWSWSPVVQLFVMQVLLPRVSFIGHLAGILAGFFLHWGMMPLKLMHPAIAIPILHLIYLGCSRRVLLSLDVQANTAELANANHLDGILFCQLLLMVISAVIFGLTTTFVIAQLPVALFWHFYSNERKKSGVSGSQTTTHTLARGFTFCSVLTLATDSMTLASWIVFKIWTPVIILLMLTKFMLVILSMLMAIAQLPSVEVGIFCYVFDLTVLQPSRILVCHPWISRFFNGKSIVSSATPSASGFPFGGEGRRLGGGSSQDDISENPCTEEISQLL